MKQRGAGLASAKHELYVPEDGGRLRLQVAPQQQAVTLETHCVGHGYRKKGSERNGMIKSHEMRRTKRMKY